MSLCMVCMAMTPVSSAFAGGFGFLPGDLFVAKSHVGNFTQGQVGATYTIVVSSRPSMPPLILLPTMGTVSVVDALPAALTATSIGGAGWSCTLATLTCTRSDSLPSGSSYPPIVLTVDVSPTAPASVVNVATVSGGGDVTPANGTASDATAIARTVTQVAVPALSAWAQLLLAALLVTTAATAVRRR
jgi:hypothetical protein